VRGWAKEIIMSSYQEITAGESATVLAGASGAGAKGDILKCIVASVDTAGAGAAATITDGSNEIPLVPASSPVGVHTINFGDGLIAQTEPWKVTTGANVTIIAIGTFS
jgi:hypothetical protein